MTSFWYHVFTKKVECHKTVWQIRLDFSVSFFSGSWPIALKSLSKKIIKWLLLYVGGTPIALQHHTKIGMTSSVASPDEQPHYMGRPFQASLLSPLLVRLKIWLMIIELHLQKGFDSSVPFWLVCLETSKIYGNKHVQSP